MHPSGVRTGASVAALVLALLCTIVLGVTCGAVHVSLQSMTLALLHSRALSSDGRVILMEIRLPRVLAAAMVGASLSAAGLLFHGLFRNPLADPYVIGSSGGAVLGATIAMVLLPQLSWLGFSAVALLAFAGSVATIAVVYSLARVGGTTEVVTLLLAGFAVSTMLSYSSYFVEVLDRDYGLGLRVLASWLHGSVGVPQWTQLGVMGLLLTGSFASAAILSRRLNTLALGDEYAQQLRVHVERVRIGIILTGSLLAAVAVSLGGLIGFVGLDRSAPRTPGCRTRPRPSTAHYGFDRRCLFGAHRHAGPHPPGSCRNPRRHPDGLYWRPVLPLLAAANEARIRCMKPLLSFERVSFSYGHRKVIADADFSIDTGACTALIGPNGGGKTTLLRLAADLLRPSTGQVLFEGTELRACSRRNIAQQIALVPQILDVPFSFTVQQIVEQGRTPYLGLFGGLSTRDWIAMERAIELTGIGPLRHRIFNELSGGERQQVKIALELAQDPKLLLLDEPTQNLDFGPQMELIALIRQPHADGVNILAAVHDLALISGTFSSVVLLSPYEPLRVGSPDQVLQPGILERAFQCPAPNLNFMSSFDRRREFAR